MQRRRAFHLRVYRHSSYYSFSPIRLLTLGFPDQIGVGVAPRWRRIQMQRRRAFHLRVNRHSSYYYFSPIRLLTLGSPDQIGVGVAPRWRRIQMQRRRAFHLRGAAQRLLLLERMRSSSTRIKGALCAYVIQLRVSYNQNDETLSRNSLRYLSKASLTIAVV